MITVNPFARQMHNSVRRRDLTTVTKMLDANSDLLNATNHKGETLLHRMVRLDAPDNVASLLARRIDMNLKDRQGSTALNVAMYEVKSEENPNAQEIIRLLIQNGACVCCPNALGKVPICTMIALHQVDLIRLAFASNPQLVNARVRDLTQHPPYHCVDAHWCGRRSSFRPVRHHPSSRFDPSFWQGHPLLVYAIWAGDIELVKMMLETGADPNAFVPYYGNYLCMDNMIHRLDIAQLLIQKGMRVSKKEEIGATALHMAVLHGSAYKLIHLLLKAGFDPNSRSGDGCTPLHDAVLQNVLGPITMLLKAGADINAATNDGTTPLMLASRMAWEEGVSLLLAKGANVHPADDDGNTALHYAAAVSYDKVTRLLIEAGGSAYQKNNLGFTSKMIDHIRSEQNLLNTRIRLSRGFSDSTKVERSRNQQKAILDSALSTERQGMGKDYYWTMDWPEARDWHKKLREKELMNKKKS